MLKWFRNRFKTPSQRRDDIMNALYNNSKGDIDIIEEAISNVLRHECHSDCIPLGKVVSECQRLCVKKYGAVGDMV